MTRSTSTTPKSSLRPRPKVLRPSRELRLYETRFRLAGQLIARRRELGMTQQQLAAASGIHQSEISRIEGGNGNPTLKTIGALAHALGAEIHLTAG